MKPQQASREPLANQALVLAEERSLEALLCDLRAIARLMVQSLTAPWQLSAALAKRFGKETLLH